MGVGKRSARLAVFFDATLANSSRKKFPVSLVFAQEPVLDGEWTETMEMEINERRVGKYTGKVVEIGKIEESQMGLEWPGRRILVVAVARRNLPSGASNLVRVQGAKFL